MDGPQSILLAALEARKATFGGDAAGRKLELLEGLEVARLGTARQVRRLHEALCFLRAYPDDKAVLGQVEKMLAGFDKRSDLRRHRKKLANSGIAGTPIHIPFFAETAIWLAERWGDRLSIDWREIKEPDDLESYLERFALFSETPGLDELSLSVREWIEHMKGASETDAAFLVRRFRALRLDARLHEMLFDALDPPFILSPGPDTPARTRLKFRQATVHWQTGPLQRERPSLTEELKRPPLSVRAATRAEARELIHLARSMMVGMDRDLDAFSYASDVDVRLVDCGLNLVFAFIGLMPDRRLMFEALYGFVVLKNGVPLGYGTVATLFGSSELAYNISETFRGGEGAHAFGRLMACARHLFGSDSFSLAPYQIGEDNPEAVKSGAWWFYQKLGFRARDAGVLRLMRRELRLTRTRPSHRSTARTLKELARQPVFFHAAEKRDDVLGILPLGNVGLHVTRFLAERYGSDRERAERELAARAARLLGLRSLDRLPAGERLAWRRWAPFICSLPGIERWNAADRASLAAVVRAKGGVRESDFVSRFDRHRRLRQAVRQLAERATLRRRRRGPLARLGGRTRAGAHQGR
ncbi:MAG: hypothetical protein ACM3SU_16740 [Acidobacteriota bacterium]